MNAYTALPAWAAILLAVQAACVTAMWLGEKMKLNGRLSALDGFTVAGVVLLVAVTVSHIVRYWIVI